MDFSSSDPLFPEFKPLFSRCRRSLDSLREVSLCQLDALFARFLPVELLSQADEGPNSRDRSYTLRRTFWAGILQALTPHTSLRCVALQFAALFGLLGKKELSSASGAYCTARKRLPLARLERALEASAAAAQQRAGTHGYLAGRPVKVVDATSVQLPDTRANQARFPQPRSQKPGCGFPVMKLGALFCLTSGALLGVVFQGLDWHDVRLFRSLWQWLKRGDIVLGDRAFGDYVSFVQLAARGVDLLTRLHQARKPDFRRAVRKLGRDDGIFRWNKPLVRPKYLTRRAFARLPAELLVRIIRFRVQEPGFRSRTIYLATGLLDDKSYPASQLIALYRRRWRLELCFRDLKTTMRMEMLRSRSPAMVRKEALFFLIAYNLLRALMAEAGTTHAVSLERMSFKAAIDAVHAYAVARARARNQEQRRHLDRQLLHALAAEAVPERPGRREPRAVKRRPKAYPLLTRPRRQYREIPHRNRYVAASKRKKPSFSKA